MEPVLYISGQCCWPNHAKAEGERGAGRVRVLDERDGAHKDPRVRPVIERRILRAGYERCEYILRQIQSEPLLALAQKGMSQSRQRPRELAGGGGVGKTFTAGEVHVGAARTGAVFELDDKRVVRILHRLRGGGYRSPQWQCHEYPESLEVQVGAPVVCGMMIVDKT